MDDETDDRKRKYNSGRSDFEVTEEEAEAWRKTQIHEADPMKAFLEKG